MPCYDGSEREVRYLQEIPADYSLVVAGLCAVMRVAEKMDIGQFLSQIDFHEAGITEKDLLEWWGEHKKKDIERQKRERKAALKRANKEAKERQKVEVIADLSPYQKKVLGFSDD